MDVGCRIGHVEQRQQACCVPGGTGGQLVPLDQHHIIPARFGQVIGDRGADGAATNDKCLNLGFHLHALPVIDSIAGRILPMTAFYSEEQATQNTSKPTWNDRKHRGRSAKGANTLMTQAVSQGRKRSTYCESLKATT